MSEGQRLPRSIPAADAQASTFPSRGRTSVANRTIDSFVGSRNGFAPTSGPILIGSVRAAQAVIVSQPSELTPTAVRWVMTAPALVADLHRCFAREVVL